MSKPLQPSRHRFWKDRSGNTGDLSCIEHATEPSPPRSADGSSAADTPPSGFPAVGLWKAPLDCSFYPRAGGALTTARPPLSLLLLLTTPFLAPVLLAPLGVLLILSSGSSSHPVLSLPLSTACCISPCCHTLRRRSSTVRTLCLRREKWDHDPPMVLTPNLTDKNFRLDRVLDENKTYSTWYGLLSDRWSLIGRGSYIK